MVGDGRSGTLAVTAVDGGSEHGAGEHGVPLGFLKLVKESCDSLEVVKLEDADGGVAKMTLGAGNPAPRTQGDKQ